MNYIDVIFIAIICLMAYLGYRNGLLYSALSFLRIFIGAPIATYVSNSYADTIYQRYFREYAINNISSQIDSTVNLDATINSVNEFIESLPKFLTDSIDLSFLDSLTTYNAVEKTVDSIVEPIAVALIKSLLFVLTLVIFYVVAGVIIRFIKRSSRRHRKGIIGRVNHILGGGFGVLHSMLTICLIVAVISFVLSVVSADSNSFLRALSESWVVNLVKDINPYNFS